MWDGGAWRERADKISVVGVGLLVVVKGSVPGGQPSLYGSRLGLYQRKSVQIGGGAISKLGRNGSRWQGSQRH